ncbi:TPA: ribulose-phosphate 3-epimerase [archaeon]|nr:ribulose-phosphate 3-epimerase [Candidatus Undinarchaeales archaeon SRR5007147.bin71]
MKIAPSILSADFANLGKDIGMVEQHTDLLHIDVMDGHFVPNISIGIPVVESIRKFTEMRLDAHLMIENPEKYIEAFSLAGADTIIVHAETIKDGKPLQDIKDHNKRTGVSINPETPVSEIESYLGGLGQVLVMSVNPGFGGQSFMPEALPKIEELKKLRKENDFQFEIAVDGGVNIETSPKIVEAGADILIAGSAIFGSDDPLGAIIKMKGDGDGN